MPWYGIRRARTRAARSTQRRRDAARLRRIRSGLLDAIPQNLRVNAWQAFDGADVAMAFLAGGLLLLCFATADRSLSLARAVALAGLVAVHPRVAARTVRAWPRSPRAVWDRPGGRGGRAGRVADERR